jgi:HEAT repeat protein
VALSIVGIAFGGAALIVVRPHATHTVPLDAREWTEALTSSDPRRREEVLSTYALTAVDGAMPPPCDPLIARLADQPEVRNDALGVLIKEARARRCVTEVIGILTDSPVPYVRAAAAHVLGEVSAASLRTPVVDALLRAVSHDTSARDAAIVALGILNDSDPQVLLALQRAFAGTQGETRGDALEALVHVEPEPERLEPLAVAALGDTSADVRAVAVLALERIGARPNRAPAIVDRLVGGLADPAPEVRVRSADAIGWIGIGNVSVFRALDIAGRDTSARVSAAVRRALQALRPAP